MADDKSDIDEIDTNMSTEDFKIVCTQNANTIELIRKCTVLEELDSSWTYKPKETIAKLNKTPPYENTNMLKDEPSSETLTSSSSKSDHFVTVPGNCSIEDGNLSFGKDFIKQDSTSNVNSETLLGSKRQRRESANENMRPSKKTKCIDSCTSSTSDLTDIKVSSLEDSVSSCQLTSNSDISFKSISSSHSFKVRKRRLKSESNLFRDILVQRSRKNTNISKHNHSENSTPGGTPTPRKEKSNRRSARPKAWRIVDLCTWIGKKGFQSITGLYSEPHREPVANHAIKEHKDEPADEIKEIRIYINEINMRQDQLKEENEILKNNMSKMMAKIEELEARLRNQSNNQQSQPPTPMPQGIPPPPPPPPPPLPPFTLGPISKKPVRSNTIPRCGSAPSRIPAPRLAITPQDIANVKLRKTKDNPIPVRSKSTVSTRQPLVTQQMLQSTRAKLGRARPVAASTPKQQLNELEKCLLQESSVSSLYRRRVVRSTFRSAEELRPRPYPASRCPRSPHSPRSPRSNSLPRVGIAPLKFPNCVLPT